MNSKENYLRAIYRLTDCGENRTTTSKLSSNLDVSDASASEAVQKLEDENLVCRAAYKGFTLSPMGKEEGRELAEKFEKLKEFFEDIGVENPEKEADQAEHSISVQAVEKINNLQL